MRRIRVNCVLGNKVFHEEALQGPRVAGHPRLQPAVAHLGYAVSDFQAAEQDSRTSISVAAHQHHRRRARLRHRAGSRVLQRIGQPDTFPDLLQ